jgi:membrane protease YdiL (CAAX protease family)
MFKTCIAVVCLFTITTGQQIDSLGRPIPERYPLWTLYVPGATHFYDGRVIEGMVFSFLEVGGIAAEIAVDSKLNPQGSTAYYNYPLLVGIQSYTIDKCDFFHNRLESFKYKHPDFRYDPISYHDLLLAPFQSKNIFTPITGGFIALALLQLYLDSRSAPYSYNQVDQMYVIDRYARRTPAMAVFGTSSMIISMGAGIGEEYMIRNSVMPYLDYQYGQTRGLWYSSLIFGVGHLPNLLFAKNPDYSAALRQAAVTTLIGYVLGLDVQNRGYQIGPAVAAHTWYDFTLMLGSFLADPKNNIFGVNMQCAVN